MSQEWARPEIGAWGWGHSQWQDIFYPDDLPADWQLTYYSNEFPLVLVPVADWQHMSAAQVADRMEDVNEGFEFILELPITDDGIDKSGKLEACVSAFSGTVLAGVIDLSAGELPPTGALQEMCRHYASILPVYVNLPADRLVHTLQDMLAPCDVSYCWRSDLPELPQRTGDLHIGIVTSHQKQPLPLPELRVHIEQFRSAAATATHSVLLFRGEPPCIDDMNNAKVITDLL